MVLTPRTTEPNSVARPTKLLEVDLVKTVKVCMVLMATVSALKALNPLTQIPILFSILWVYVTNSSTPDL